jgi:hypothetical protein
LGLALISIIEFSDEPNFFADLEFDVNNPENRPMSNMPKLCLRLQIVPEAFFALAGINFFAERNEPIFLLYIGNKLLNNFTR